VKPYLCAHPGESRDIFPGVSFSIKKDGLAFLFLIAATLIPFYPTLLNDLVWDDTFIIEKYLPFLNSFSRLWEPYFRVYSRPITSLSFLWDYSLWYRNPFGYHLTNLILHGLNGLLLYILLSSLRINYLLCLAGSLFFITWPLHLENIAWISGRTDLLAVFFILLFFLSFLLWIKTKKRALFLPLLLFGWFAILSKEIGFICPVILMLFYWIFKESKPYRQELWLAMLIGLPPMTLKYWPTTSQPMNIRFPSHLFDIVNNSLLAIGFNLKKILYPYWIQPFIPNLPTSWVFFLSGLIFLIGAVIYILRGKNPWARLAVGSFLFSLIVILPPAFTNLSTTPLAERYLYLPSVILAISVFVLLHKAISSLPRLPIMLSFLFLPLILLNSWISFNYGDIWKNDLVFWEYVKEQTGHWLADQQLGVEFLKKGDLQQAKAHLNRGYVNGGNRYASNQSIYFENMGIIYSKKGDQATAEALIKKSVALMPNPSNLNNLAMLYLTNFRRDPDNKNRLSLAYHYLLRAYQDRPYDMDVLLGLGILYAQYGESRPALYYFNQVLELDPRSAQGQRALFWIFFLEKNKKVTP